LGKVIMGATVSLDGYIADPSDGVGPLFEWYGNGEVEVTGTDPDRVFRVSAASAEHIHSMWPTIGAVVIGRRLFDMTNGWNGVPAVGDHVFVVTHQAPTDWPFPEAPFTFVTEGVHSAIEQARAYAGDRNISVTAGQIGSQALDEGLVDELDIALTPVVMGSGIPFFADLTAIPILLENPKVVEGDRVIHLTFSVRRPA
jgi:dihydrofolate reductase